MNELSIKNRIHILEAIIWAQEHHNKVMYLSDTSDNRVVYREQLMEKYGFDYEQAVAITEMRSIGFTVQERKKTKEELADLMRMQNGGE